MMVSATSTPRLAKRDSRANQTREDGARDEECTTSGSHMLECSLSADIHAVASRCRVDARSGRCVGSSLTMALCPASAVMGCKAGEQRGCQRRGRRGRWLRSSLRGPLRDSAPLCCHDSARSAPRRVTRPRRPPRISRAAASHAEISGHRERVVQNVTAICAICAALRDSAPLCSTLLHSARLC